MSGAPDSFNKNKTIQEDADSSKEKTIEDQLADGKTMVIPVIEEFFTVDKEVVETGKIHIKKHITTEDSTIDTPLVNESYEIERIEVKNKISDERPAIRHEGDELIIPVVKEITEVKIRYEVTEEIHVIKKKTVIPHQQQVTLNKEKVTIEREHSK